MDGLNMILLLEMAYMWVLKYSSNYILSIIIILILHFIHNIYFRMITKTIFGTVEGSLNDLSSGTLKPIGRVLLGTSLGARTTGYISLGGRLTSIKHTSLSTEVEHNTERSYCICKLEIGLAPAISVLYTWKFIEQDLLLRIYARYKLILNIVEQKFNFNFFPFYF